MIIISSHARERMRRKDITEDEIKKCLIDGETIIKKLVKGEMRCLKTVDLKYKELAVVYTINKNGDKRVITCYPIRKKRRSV